MTSPEMKSTPVEHPHSFTSSLLTQPPISAANQNAGPTSCQDLSEIWGLYKLAPADSRKDLTAAHSRVNTSGFGLSSPALQQPSTKPFSGLPSRQLMTSPHREAGEAERERPGIVYPLLPRAARPDTRLMIDAALPEAAALDRRCRPPTVLEINGNQAEGGFPATRTTMAPVPQTPPQSLNGGLQAIQALASTRPMV